MTFDERMTAERIKTQRIGMDLSAQLALSIARNEVRRVIDIEVAKAVRTGTAEELETLHRIRRDIEATFKGMRK